MARAKELAPIIDQIRTLLRHAERGQVNSGIELWRQTAGDDFEIFLDILEGVITGSLKRLYNHQLRKNDDWWHENFSQRPREFLNLFNTSFNLGGDPLVERIEDAVKTLKESKIEYMYLPELNKLVKSPNPEEEE